jgi:hypothetical protein
MRIAYGLVYSSHNSTKHRQLRWCGSSGLNSPLNTPRTSLIRVPAVNFSELLIEIFYSFVYACLSCIRAAQCAVWGSSPATGSCKRNIFSPGSTHTLIYLLALLINRISGTWCSIVVSLLSALLQV